MESNTQVPFGGKAALLALLMAALTLASARAAQPVAFPHGKHIKLGLACVDCHTGADTRAAAGIRQFKNACCVTQASHSRPGGSEGHRLLEQNIEIPWERVYGFAPSAHVAFRHAPHYEAGIGCATCHGDLTKAGVAERTITHNMGTCLACHRQKHASEDCAACHY